MFEAEIEMEKKSSNWLPLVLIILLGGGLLGGAGYLYYQYAHGGLTTEQAATVLGDSLKLQAATTQFHTGNVVPSVKEKPDGAHYRLLQKAGYVKIAPGKGAAKIITLTANGEKLVAAFPEFKPVKEDDGTQLYDLPLANRQLVSVTKVTMSGLSAATVEYTWKWDSTELGNLFDAAGATFSTFSGYDRSQLIDKYGSAFFHGDATKAVARMIKGDKGWQIAP